jgi:hypothetical protein
MKKLPKFTLVRKIDLALPETDPTQPRPPTIRKGKLPNSKSPVGETTVLRSAKAEHLIITTIRESPGLAKVFASLDPQFQMAYLSSFATSTAKAMRPGTTAPLDVNHDAVKVIRDLARQETVRRVGLLDMGAWIGGLPPLLERLNNAQSFFTIFEIQAPLPGGMLKSPAGMEAWTNSQLGKPLRQKEPFEPHVIANEYFVAAQDIRKSLGLDFVVGISPAMVAGVEPDGEIFWNHFSAVADKTILLSSADVRQFSREAGRPFEAGVGVLLVASLLIAVNGHLQYHDDTGCIFDYNGSRVSLANSIRRMRIDGSCLRTMTSDQRDAARQMLATLRRMKRSAA